MKYEAIKQPVKTKKVYTLTGNVWCQCASCGERFGSNSGYCALYCKDCRTAPARKKLNDENKAFFNSLKQ